MILILVSNTVQFVVSLGHRLGQTVLPKTLQKCQSKEVSLILVFDMFKIFSVVLRPIGAFVIVVSRNLLIVEDVIPWSSLRLSFIEPLNSLGSQR